MIENIRTGTDQSFFKARVNEAINTMLECLLNKDETNCNKCKNCENVDVCCYLMESVVVYNHRETKKLI